MNFGPYALGIVLVGISFCREVTGDPELCWLKQVGRLFSHVHLFHAWTGQGWRGSLKSRPLLLCSFNVRASPPKLPPHETAISRSPITLPHSSQQRRKDKDMFSPSKDNTWTLVTSPTTCRPECAHAWLQGDWECSLDSGQPSCRLKLGVLLLRKKGRIEIGGPPVVCLRTVGFFPAWLCAKMIFSSP